MVEPMNLFITWPSIGEMRGDTMQLHYHQQTHLPNQKYMYIKLANSMSLIQRVKFKHAPPPV